MPVFEYEVADRRGALTRGRAEAPNQGDLILRFRERGQLVVALRQAAPGALAGALDVGPLSEAVKQSYRRLSRGVGITSLVLFTGQLAAMLAGGLHLVRVLSALAADTTNKHFKAALEQVRDAVTAGSSFADALGQHPHIFSPLYQAIVRAGELSGSLPQVLESLTSYLEKVAAIRRKVRGAIAYPSVILSVALLIVTVMILKVVPVFEGVYARARVTLPAPTRLLVALSAIMRDYTWLVVLGLIALAVVGFVIVQSAPGRHFFDAVKLRLPVFGPLLRKAILARTCRTLAVLLNAGIPLIEAIEKVSRVAGNRVIQGALATATRRMRDGATIADTLRQTGEFPVMVVQLVATGEESGTLPAMLTRAATYYEQQVDSTVSVLSTLIEPVMIVIMGAIAGGIIFALYLPIFGLGQALRGMTR
jgi:type IV pilus assembly protein PilC